MTASEYVEKARQLDHGGLLALWERVQEKTVGGEWAPGKALEYLVLRAFELDSEAQVRVRYPYQVFMHGKVIEEVDGALYVDGEAFLVEAKDWEDTMDVVPIAKMRSQLLRRPAFVMGVVFSTSEFTEPARLLASYMMPQAVLLWGGLDMDRALRKGKMVAGLRKKVAHAVEHGFPYYGLLEEDLA